MVEAIDGGKIGDVWKEGKDAPEKYSPNKFYTKAEPTPQAKYSPPGLVFHRPADFESAARSTVGKMFLYASLAIRFLTFRPKSAAISVVCDTIKIFLSGNFPKTMRENK